MTNQIESRQICIEFWAGLLGQSVLSRLSKLYRSLVWEGFIVLAVASANEGTSKDNPTTPKEDTQEIVAGVSEPSSSHSIHRPVVSIDDIQEANKSFVCALKSFTPPLVVTSSVGRSLAELMSLLVRLCTGPLHRPPRRGPGMTAAVHYVPLSDNAIAVSMKITDLFLESLTWNVPTPAVDREITTDTAMRKWLFSG